MMDGTVISKPIHNDLWPSMAESPAGQSAMDKYISIDDGLTLQ